jgi:hypothetical protein
MIKLLLVKRRSLVYTAVSLNPRIVQPLRDYFIVFRVPQNRLKEEKLYKTIMIMKLTITVGMI